MPRIASAVFRKENPRGKRAAALHFASPALPTHVHQAPPTWHVAKCRVKVQLASSQVGRFAA